MRNSQEMCDVTLISNNDISEHCHRLVLAGCSPYFHAMLTNFKEKDQRDIKLGWITSKILSLILNYIYTSEIIITQDTVQDLIAASDMLELIDLYNVCINFLENQLNVTNCLGIEAIANLYSCSDLLTQAQCFIEEHFTDVVNGEEFLNLSVDRLITLLGNDHLNVETEEIIFESVLNWMKHDLQNREKFLLDLVKNIRVKLLKPEYLVKKFNQNLFLKLLIDVNGRLFFNLFKLKYGELDENDETWFSTSSTPRESVNSSKVLLVFGGFIRKMPTTIVEFFDFDTKQWHSASDMLGTSGKKLGATVLNGKLYVADCDATVQVYDSQINKWSYLPQMLKVREGLGFASINNSLYAMGGYNNNRELSKTCEQFNFSSQKWSYVQSMLWGASRFGAHFLNNVLYIVGGMNDESNLRSAQAFNFETQKWSILPDMSIERVNPATSVLNGILYVCGGYSRSYWSSVECYDPATNSWTIVENMNVARGGASAITYKGLIYVIGGFNGQILSSIEVFDPEQNMWSLLPINMTSGRANHTSVLMSKSNFKWYYTPQS